MNEKIMYGNRECWEEQNEEIKETWKLEEFLMTQYTINPNKPTSTSIPSFQLYEHNPCQSSVGTKGMLEHILKCDKSTPLIKVFVMELEQQKYDVNKG